VPPRSPDFQILARKIVWWFDQNARDLPWRRTRDPYAIWISEVMLQQTQVKTVIPYWEHWMKLFPGIQALAEAGEEEILKAWEGLGYYSRARNLQKAARQIVLENRGEFPRTVRDVLKLPGIGRYTAGAICSIAFGQKTPILDGNVARVLSRLFVISGSAKETSTLKEFWRLSTELVENSGDSSALNQGLMELGATVCLPRKPLCRECPLKGRCLAQLTKRVEEFPKAQEKQPIRQRQFVAIIVQKNGAVLVRKRAAEAVNGGLWEFPNREIQPREDVAAIVRGFGVACELVATIKHSITNNRITLRAFAAPANGNSKTLAKRFEAQWHLIEDLEALPFSSAHARLRTLVQGGCGTWNKGAVA
jgi:A/G-specific adenine glycosylase